MKRRLLLSKAPMAAIALSAISYKSINDIQKSAFERKTHAEGCNCQICLQTSNSLEKQE